MLMLGGGNKPFIDRSITHLDHGWDDSSLAEKQKVVQSARFYGSIRLNHHDWEERMLLHTLNGSVGNLFGDSVGPG